MIIAKTPLRLSLFGGSTDYSSFYKEHGSFLIGTTIDKYSYLSMRFRPKVLSKENLVVYSQMNYAKTFDDIQNPLIRETLKYGNVKDFVELFSFADIPSRTGLGGSSSYCVGLLYLINELYNRPEMTKKQLVHDAITIERTILKEAGGIQDSIWPAYGGLNSIEIQPDGDFSVKPLPITEDFYKEFEDSIVLIYTNEQRDKEDIAKSHDSTDKDKTRILEISKEAYSCFVKENIKGIGHLMYETWKEKRNLSALISNQKVDETIAAVIRDGAYGAKLLGAGGCGFVMAVCHSVAKEKIIKRFGDDVLPIKFESKGVSRIHA